MKSQLIKNGYAIWPARIEENLIATLKREVFHDEQPGQRCLLDLPIVATLASSLGRALIEADVLASDSVAVQAIAFDKTANTNWKVMWHQDLMFPFARRTSTAGYKLASVKEGVNYASPPIEVLSELLAVRLHLDDCTAENGPLRVSPGTHLEGIIPSDKILQRVSSMGEVACLAAAGEVFLMRPLLLHASSKAIRPDHRRVLHFVYHSGKSMAEQWFRAVRSVQVVSSGL